jgi:thiol-disulfide isomerase/thioredoxin
MRIFAAGMLLAITGMFSAAVAEDTAPVPRRAPEFVFTLEDNKQLLLSSFRGKVVAIAFMFTTCPHCQALCPILGSIQKDYAAKGVQFVGNVIDPGAKDGLPNFSKTYVQGHFPVGWSTQQSALEFLKHPDPHYYVPMLAFIDRKGNIMAQYIGDNPFFAESAACPPGSPATCAQEKNIRAELDKMLGLPTPRPAAAKSMTKTVQPNVKK